MTTHKPILIPAVAVLAVLCGAAQSQAADTPVAVITANSGGCATCEPIASGGVSCAPTGHALLLRFHKSRETTICPGSCFGYFPTQWRKWDEACPYPQPGVILTDPHPTTPYPMIPPASDRAPKKDGTVPPPPPGPPRVTASGSRIN